MMKMSPQRNGAESTPICRCRVLYMGSAVPHVTKDGLQGIQEPLKELYPEQGALGARGIDSWLSVWSNGLLLENVDENHKKVTRFFPIESLHYCAAVRYVLIPDKASNGPSTPKFLPLDSPFARAPNPSHPPLFAGILRRITGIKVLECHAFICKREMAANALVRCCFHAYADSSYAKHIDEKGSLYGTLRNSSRGDDAIDRVEFWRQASKTNGKNGSTTTLNSHNGNLGTLRSIDQMTLGDDVSVYNGDENHKVWAGTSVDENIYGDAHATYSSNAIGMGKTMRPRQAITPAPPPPPPLKEEKKKIKKEQQEKKRKKHASESRDDAFNHPPMNGSLMRHAQSMNNLSGRGSAAMRIPPQPIYSNGTIMRPNGFAPGPVPNGYPGNPVMFIPTTLPHRGGGKKKATMQQQHAGTFSHRPKNMLPFSPKTMPPHFVSMGPPVSLMPFPGKKSKNLPQHVYAVEEPVYVPSGGPLSPAASYQPGHFPHESYLIRQYATMENGKKKRGRKNKVPVAVPVPVPAPVPPNGGVYMGNHGLASTNGQGPVEVPYGPVSNGNGPRDGDSPEGIADSPDNDDESPFNTGIYRKKGHLNERAFSYSIRQEHRSRSYGSLANLRFSTPMHDGGGSALNLAPKEDSKKEREIMQMMQDLDLSGDELERSEVPKAVYESKRLAAVTAGASAGKLRR